MRAWIGPGLLAALPLVVWPGLARPFSTPKLVVLAVASALVPALTWGRRPDDGRGRVPVAVVGLTLGWAAAFLLAAALSDLPAFVPLVLGLAAPAFALAVCASGSSPAALLCGQALGATLCGIVALAQWLGADPFLWLGWHPPIGGESVRMRVYGTLGNPNFVGVVMAMSLPLTLGARHALTQPVARRACDVALAVQALALVATGSRGAVLGLCAATTAYAALRWSHRVRVALAGLAVFGAAAVLASPARPLDTTAAGRLHLWRIVAPQVLDAPLAGQGPGAVELRFPEWQRAAAREGVRDRRFAGLTDHVHNDYLEALVERGVPGLVSVIAPLLALAVVVWRVPRPVSPPLAGTVAAVAAGAACAMVDFPLARPVELAWWWVAVVLAWSLADRPTTEVASADRHV